MKKLLLGFLLFTFLISCGNKKAKMDPFATITEMVDSAGHKADTLLEAEVKEEPKPMEADELFDDFIFNYASDDALQRQRTVFPLPYYNRDTPSKIEEEFWKHDYLFTKQNYYTLLFDKEEDMDMVGDTTLTSVQVEWIFLKTRMVKFIISGFRLVAADNGVVIAASYWGKFKTTFQMLMVIVLILNFDNCYFQLLGTVLTYIALVLTVVSLIDYLWKNRAVLKEQK